MHKISKLSVLTLFFPDSGSPLVQRDGSGNLELVGINSWRTGTDCGEPNSPDVFIHISAFSSWITANIVG